MMRGVRSLLAGLTAAATLMALAPTVVQAKPSDGISMPGLCRAPYNVAVQRAADVSRVAGQRILVLDGRRVNLKGKGWAAENPRDPSWTLWFHSLAWLVPLALEDPRTAVDIFIERDKALPDPGASVGNRLRRPVGWTAGQFRTRLDVANCLYNLTDDPRLVPIAKRLAAVSMDPRRYPGPPYFPVHNHGTMSNVTLMQAGKAFGQTEWVDFALKRFKRDLPLVFEPCGMMREQSSTYQVHNVKLWEKTAAQLGAPLEAERRALGALVRPDGVLEAIGDGQPDSGLVPNGESLWCPETGWAAGTLRGGSADDTARDAHFVLRFGPPMRFHGHLDHGSLTWYALGAPVLSDRGLFSKDRGPRFDYAHTMAAHSVFEPVGSPDYNPVTKASRISAKEFALSDAQDGIARTRDVTISPTRLVVRDRGTGAKEWIQHWQLAPGWEPTKTGAINEAAGLTLTIDCPRLRPVRVEAFTAWRTTVDAWDLQCRVDSDKRKSARLTTTLVVKPSP
jgi:hypothetical protein